MIITRNSKKQITIISAMTSNHSGFLISCFKVNVIAIIFTWFTALTLLMFIGTYAIYIDKMSKAVNKWP